MVINWKRGNSRQMPSHLLGSFQTKGTRISFGNLVPSFHPTVDPCGMSQWEKSLLFLGCWPGVGTPGSGLTEFPLVLQSSCPAPLPTSAPSPAPPPPSPSPGRRRSRATATSRTTNSTTWRRGRTRSRYGAAALPELP